MAVEGRIELAGGESLEVVEQADGACQLVIRLDGRSGSFARWYISLDAARAEQLGRLLTGGAP